MRIYSNSGSDSIRPKAWTPVMTRAAMRAWRLVITATTADRKTYVTVGPGHGKVLFDSFTFAPVLVTVNKKGKVSLPSDPRISETQVPHWR
jgi:hypothetical protein